MKIIWLIFSAVSWAEIKNLERSEQAHFLVSPHSPLDFASAVLQLSKGLISNQKEISKKLYLRLNSRHPHADVVISTDTFKPF